MTTHYVSRVLTTGGDTTAADTMMRFVGWSMFMLLLTIIAATLFQFLLRTRQRLAYNLPPARTAQAWSATPAHPVEAALDAAAEVLKAHGRESDASIVGQVDWKDLPVRAQEDARSAARAIVDTFTHLDQLDPAVATDTGPDGTTAQQDADTVVDVAVAALTRAGVAAQQHDVDALRALRRYAAQWDGDDSLDLPR